MNSKKCEHLKNNVNKTKLTENQNKIIEFY